MFNRGKVKHLLVGRIFLLLVSVILAGMLSVPAAYAEESTEGKTQTKKVVRASYFDSGNGFFTESSDGEPKSGYAYEYMQILANYNNWEYEYVYGPWSEHYQMLIDGDIDLMFDVSYTEERAQEMYFSERPMGTEHFYLYTNSNQDTGISKDDYTTLEGKRVGIVEETVQVEIFENWLKEQGISCEIVKYEGESDRLEDFDNGKIDAQVTLDTYVADNWNPIVEIGSADYYIAVSKDRPDLLEELNQAQEEIFEGDLYFNETLQKKYFSGTVIQKNLSSAEQEWLQSHGTIRVGYLENYLPYCASDSETGEMTGAFKILLNQLKQEYGEYGLEISCVPYSSMQEIWQALQNEEIDVMLPIRGSLWIAEGEGFILSNSLASSRLVLLYTGEYPDKNVKRVAAIQSMPVTERSLKEIYPDASLVWFDDMEDCIQEAVSKEDTCILMDSCVYAYFSRKYSALNRLQTAFLANSAEIRLGVRQGDTELLSILNKGISFTSEEELNDALITYSQQVVTYTLRDFLEEHALEVIGGILAVFAIIIGILSAYFVSLNRHRKHLMAAKQEAEEARERAEEAYQVKSNFLTNMSHDIRTPMNAIIGFTNLAMTHLDNPKQTQQYLDKISISAEHLLSLLNDILDMSQMEQEQITLEISVCNLPEIIEDMKFIMEERIAEKQIHFSMDMDKVRHTHVLGDRKRLAQLLNSILENAVKFTESGGHVSVKLAELEPEAELSDCESQQKKLQKALYEFRIKDDGIGMSEEFQAHIFELFSRERTSTVSGMQGTGIGLCIAKNMVDKMGGTIEVTSEEGIGTEFVIRLELPFVSEIQEMDSQTPCMTGQDWNQKQKNTEKIVEVKSDIAGKKILLVEDNELNREIAVEILEDEGYHVETAENGAVAVDRIRRAEENEFHVILMDIQMPVMDGYEATKSIRNLPNGNYEKLPIIAMTANSQNEDQEKVKEAGMNGYIAKPIDVDIVVNVLKKAMGQG